MFRAIHNFACKSNKIRGRRAAAGAKGNSVETLESRVLMSAAIEPPVVVHSVSVSLRYNDELVITATGPDDNVAVAQSGAKLNIIADGIASTDTVPAAGVFVYTRGGKDSISIASSVTAQTTIDSIDNAPTTIHSTGSHVIAWVDSTDIVTGTASVHWVSSFADGVSKKLGASLPNPSDSGKTIAVNRSLLGTGPVAADVNQGEAGDCYFVSSLAAFANQRPQAIRNSVVDLGDGTYAVEFFENGKPEYVRVNNSFPVGPFEGFKFAHPGANNTIWAMVMEKAFAWFRDHDNTYASINNGAPAEAFGDLDVSSTAVLAPTFSDTQLYDMLASDLKAGDPITFSTMSPQDLVSDHAYTLIGVKIVSGVNLYTFRNPWGTSGDSLENSQGIVTLNYDQIIDNFSIGTAATH